MPPSTEVPMFLLKSNSFTGTVQIHITGIAYARELDTAEWWIKKGNVHFATYKPSSTKHNM